MGIASVVRPSVVVFGVIVRVRELVRKSDRTRYGREVVLSQDSGAQARVTVYDSVEAILPSIGEVWAVEATVEESRDYGATLVYERSAEAVLDAVHSALSAPAGK